MLAGDRWKNRDRFGVGLGNRRAGAGQDPSGAPSNPQPTAKEEESMTRLTQATLVIVICALVGSRPTAAANLGIRLPSLTGDRGDSGGSEQPAIGGMKVPNWLSGGRQGNGGSRKRTSTLC